MVRAEASHEPRSFERDPADDAHQRFLHQFLAAMELEPFTPRERAYARSVFEALQLRAEALLAEGA